MKAKHRQWNTLGSIIAAAALATAALTLAGCGGGGGSLSPSVGGPTGSGSPERGSLSVSLLPVGGTRAVPDVSFYRAILMGDGMAVADEDYIMSMSGPLQFTFEDVPLGLKTVLCAGIWQDPMNQGAYEVVAIGALVTKIVGGQKIQRTLEVVPASRFDSVITGTTSVSGVYSRQLALDQAAILRWEDGSEEYLGVDKVPPAVDAPNVVMFARKDPGATGGVVKFQPAVTIVPSAFDPYTPKVQSTQRTSSGGTAQSGTWTCVAEGFEGGLWDLTQDYYGGGYPVSTTRQVSETNGQTPDIPRFEPATAARIRTKFALAGGQVVYEALSWYVSRLGLTMRLEFDSTKSPNGYGDPVIDKILFLTGTTAEFIQGQEPVQGGTSVLPLSNGLAYSYASNQPAGASVGVSFDYFAVISAGVSAGNNAVSVYLNQALDVNTALPSANTFSVKVNGSARTVTGVTVNTSYPHELVITFSGALPQADDTFDVQVGPVMAVSGATLQQMAPYNTGSGTVQ